MNTVAHLFPQYASYFHNESDPVKKMALEGKKKEGKGKGKVLVHFLKDAMHQDWKKNTAIKGLIEQAISSLTKAKEKHALSDGTKKKFKELKKEFRSQEKQADVQAKQVNDNAAKPKSFEETASELTALFLQRIKKCPIANFLYKQACDIQKAQHAKGQNLSPDIKIKLLPKRENEFAGSSKWDHGIIELAHDGESHDDMLSTLIFELCNFKRQEHFVNLHHKVHKKEIKDADSYAKEMERIEHESCVEHHRIIQKAMSKNKWNPLMDLYRAKEWNTPGQFEAFWNQIKNSSHAQYYRDWFHKHVPAK